MLAAIAVYNYYRQSDKSDTNKITEFTDMTTKATEKELVSRFWTHLRERCLKQDVDPDYLEDIDAEFTLPDLYLAMEVCGLDRQDFLDDAEKAFPDETKTKPVKGKKGGKK
jgi:hypothetical protein